jgi:acetyl esterase/lipase
MKTTVLIAVFSFPLILAQSSAAPPKALYPDAAPVCSCESLAKLSLPNTTIDSAAIDPSDGPCGVTATVTHPPTGDRVRVFIGLPTKGWNGRFRGTGGGVFTGGSPADVDNFVSIRSPALATSTKDGRGADQPQTHVYKTVGNLPIKADVYRPGDGVVRPVVVWIHGGALINGHREQIPGLLKDPLLAAGCILVSIDYRLAPETKLPGIIEDLEDAFRWIRQEGPRLFNADPDRVAVVGGSAGGYLTLTAGFRVRPRPVALVALWGYGDLVGPWYSTPSPHPAHHRLKPSREEAYQQVAGPPIADARDRKGNGGAFYQFCRQQGLWPKAVSGWDPHTEAEKFFPYMPVKNVTADFPPTLLVHGEEDTDVPCAQSVMMAAALRANNVEHRLISYPKAEHGLAGAPPAKVEEAYVATVAFLRTHLERRKQ